jgi:hypothetical protein
LHNLDIQYVQFLLCSDVCHDSFKEYLESHFVETDVRVFSGKECSIQAYKSVYVFYSTPTRNHKVRCSVELHVSDMFVGISFDNGDFELTDGRMKAVGKKLLPDGAFYSSQWYKTERRTTRWFQKFDEMKDALVYYQELIKRRVIYYEDFIKE